MASTNACAQARYKYYREVSITHREIILSGPGLPRDALISKAMSIVVKFTGPEG